MNKKQILEHVKTVNTTQEIALDFAKRACKAINNQLSVEIKRNGFSVEDIEKGAIKLVREVKYADTDPRFVGESFTIETKDGIKRIIMCVKWSPNGFQIERNSDAVANAIKVNPSFKIQKNVPLVTGDMTQREIDIEARANQYMIDHENELKSQSNVKAN